LFCWCISLFTKTTPPPPSRPSTCGAFDGQCKNWLHSVPPRSGVSKGYAMQYSVDTYHYKKFWQELIAYFPSYDTGHIENDASNKSSIVACVFVAAVTFLLNRCLATIGGFLPSRCLATIGGSTDTPTHTHTHTHTPTHTHTE
jgi:hypothetical protein